MSGLYHRRGFARALLGGAVRHLQHYVARPEYRALYRFHASLRHLPRQVPAQVRFSGRPIALCDGPSFLSAWDEIFVNGIYDVGAPRDTRPRLIDVGANIGLAALYWKWRYGQIDYVGFEPDPRIAACCRVNLRVWGVEGELIEAAVGARAGSATFQPDGADGGRLVPTKDAERATAVAVRVERLEHHLGSPVDLLKIDIEGAEAELLEDIAPRLGRVRALFVEWHSIAGRSGLGRAIALLESAGFDCYVQVAFGPPQPFRFQPVTGFTQNLNIYAVRP